MLFLELEAVEDGRKQTPGPLARSHARALRRVLAKTRPWRSKEYLLRYDSAT